MLRRRLLAVPLALALGLALLSPVAAEAPPPSHSVAVVGPSLAGIADLGYYETGSTTVLWPVYDIGGGTVRAWTAPGSVYLARFDQMLARYPNPAKVWLLIADHDRDYGSNIATMRAQAHALIALIRQRTAAPIYVTPMPRYTSPLSCPSVARAVGDTATVRLELIAEGLALPGPILPAKSPADLGRCDPNKIGRRKDGPVLRGAFG